MKKIKALVLLILTGGGATVFAQVDPAAEAELEAIAEGGAKKIEVIEAAEAGRDAAAVAGGEQVGAVVEPAAQDIDDKPWKATLELTQAVGSGTFARNAYVRDDLWKQTFDLRGSYTFPVLGHKLAAGVRWLFDVELSTPNNDPPRRWFPQDTWLTLTDPEIFVEPWTDIALSAGVVAFLPTSYESLNVNKRWLGLRGWAGVSRKFSPLTLEYTFMYTKNFNSSHVPVASVATTRGGDAVRSAGSGFFHLEQGAPNTSFSMLHNFAVGWEITEALSASYSVALINAWSYNVFSEPDEFTGVNADSGRQRKLDQLLPTLEVGYSLTSDLGDVIALPFELTVLGRVTALHPAQSRDNGDILWPVFFNTFGADRAANNYGTVEVGLRGTY